MVTDLFSTLGSAKLTCDPSIPRRKATWTVVLRMDGFTLEPPCGGVYSRYPIRQSLVLAGWVRRHGTDGLDVRIDVRECVNGRVGALLQNHYWLMQALYGPDWRSGQRVWPHSAAALL